MIATISVWIFYFLIAFTKDVVGQCHSFGIDIGNGGTYYINPASPAQFSFTSGFSGCTAIESPVLQLPDGNTLTCSPVVEGAGVTMFSTW
jgi:hypothetical protein